MTIATMTSVDLLQTLRRIARNQSAVRLLNIYKGLPISYDTAITSVGASEIQVPSSRNHIACLYYQGESFLQGDELPVIIRARVVRLNLAKDYAVFSGFEAVKNDIGKRLQIRVEPDEPLVATIQFKGSAYEFLAPVADISANGVSVLFESDMLPTRIAQPGNELTLSVALPDSVSRRVKKALQTPRIEGRKLSPPLHTNLHSGQNNEGVVTATGRIIAVRHEAASKRYRLNAQLYFKDMSRMVILQYISQRQTEIIKDLRILSEDLYNGRSNLV